jgi:hypothetical protein
MEERKRLWSPTAALYAVALGLFAVAGAIGQSHSYQFAPGLDNMSLWRGDNTSGKVVLCSTDKEVREIADAITRGLDDFKGVDVRRC